MPLTCAFFPWLRPCYISRTRAYISSETREFAEFIKQLMIQLLERGFQQMIPELIINNCGRVARWLQVLATEQKRAWRATINIPNKIARSVENIYIFRLPSRTGVHDNNYN